jgi:hypothetical protein
MRGSSRPNEFTFAVHAIQARSYGRPVSGPASSSSAMPAQDLTG